jgi:hypothetical protein
MSVPYGTPQPAASHPSAGGLNLGMILGLAAAGLALVSYACSFSDDASTVSLGIVLPLLIGGGLLAGASALPRTPRTLLPAAVLSATGALLLLLDVIRTEGDTQAIVVVILIASLLQTAACVVGLLVEAGVVNLQPKPAAYGAPAWGPQSGAFPQQGGQYGQQYGGAPQQYGGGPGGQQLPAGGQPGQPGQHSQHSQQGQHSQGQHSQQTGQGQYGGQGQSGQPQFGQQPYGQGQQGGQYGQQHPGTPPGGFSGPGQG